MAWTLEHLVDETLMSFDPGDKKNGSLYVCDVEKGVAGAALVQSLREAGLWSAVEAKTVGDEQKAAYKGGLQFNEAREYAISGHRVVLLRCDHPKFPSDAERWAAWNQAAAELSKQGSL